MDRRRHCQYTTLHLSGAITYLLWAKIWGDVISTHLCIYVTRKHTICRSKRQGDTISPPFWIYPTRSRTACGRKHEETWWMNLSASIWRDHVLPGAQIWDTMSATFCTYPARLPTSCRQKHEERPWAQHFTPIRRDHLPTVNKNATWYHHQAIIDPSNEITYGLWAKTHWNTMSTSLCIDPTRSRTICGWRHEVKPWAHFPGLSDAITHILWVIRRSALNLRHRTVIRTICFCGWTYEWNC